MFTFEKFYVLYMHTYNAFSSSGNDLRMLHASTYTH